jgi:2'-5' RNA ligase
MKDLTLIAKRLEGTLMALPEFQIRPVILSAFPNVNHPRVLMLEPAGSSAEMDALMAMLGSILADGGHLQERSFHPHITLGRTESGEAFPAGTDFSSAIDPVHVHEITLFQSMMTDTGRRYVPLQRIPLRKLRS